MPSFSEISLNNSGLLNKKDPFSDPNTLGLLGAAFSLLESSGPSLTKIGTGQALGRAGMAGLQMRNQAAENEFNRRYKEAQMGQMSKNNGIISDLTPGNYTPESLAAFYQDYQTNMKPNYSLLKESVNQFRAGGVTYVMGADGKPVALVDPSVAAQNAGDISAAQAAGASAGEAQSKAKQGLPAVQGLEDQLVRIMADPKFDSSVGMIDQFTGKVGEAFGSKEGVLGGEAERIGNQLVVDFAEKWKGAISDKELKLFKDSVPGRGSSAQTWRHWYQNEFLPMKQRAETAAGVTAGPAAVRKYNPATGKLE